MSDGMKGFELAKELNIKALDLIDKVKPLDIKLKNHMADLSAEQVEKIKNFFNPPAPQETAPKKKTVARRVKKDDDAAPAASESKVVLRRTPTVIRRDTPGALSTDAAIDDRQESTEAQAYVAPTEEFHAAPQGGADLADGEVTESFHAQSEQVTETVPEESAPAGAPVAAAATEAAPAVEVRRGPRYSIIRVASPEAPVVRRPLIVEEAPAGATYTSGRPKTTVNVGGTTTGPRTFSATTTGPRTEAEREEERKKAHSSPKVREAAEAVAAFKSTDYLRRERVYQVKKKRLSLGKAVGKTHLTTSAAHKRIVEVDGDISVDDLAMEMAVKALDVARKLKAMGSMQPEESVSFEDWIIDAETAQLVAAEFQFEVKDVSFKEEQLLKQAQHQLDAEEEGAESRPPIITIMGHVDHGKTSLLDTIRKARVVSGEAGGITQHIGAYSVTVADAIKNLQAAQSEGAGSKDKKKDKKADKADKSAKAKKGSADVKVETLTFLDTPGHAAFTAMRARGARVTDIVILVVSAIDGVMPQTREAIEHAKAAGVPLIVAVNKMDLPDANPDRIRQQLSEFGIMSEDWGGDTIFVPVSAKTGMGVDKLLEMVQLQAELLELKARAVGVGEGVIIEARLDKGRGPLATCLVRKGRLEVGQFIVAGTMTGKIRALINDRGEQVKFALPSTPVEVLGLGGVPEAGDMLNVMPDDKQARILAENRIEQKRRDSQDSGASLEDIYARLAAGEVKELPLLLKADVRGSAEAISAALQKLPQTKVKLKILSVGVGAISESDVLLASASKAIILGFNVRPDTKSHNEAERLGVQVKAYSIIYELLDEVEKAMAGLLDPTFKETITGRAEVRNVFNITKVGAVAGCSIVKGKIQRSNSARLIRDGRVIFTGKLSGLKRFKDEVKEVQVGQECGMGFVGYQDLQKGDVIECFEVETIQRAL